MNHPTRFLLAPLVAVAFLASAALGISAERPNILFIIFDDWSWNHAGAYGCNWVKTPNFDRVAREGVLFKNAFTSNPKCSPCRASILTGRNSWQLEEASCHNGIFPSKFSVYPDLLEQAGYVVGLTGKGWGPGDFKSTGFKRNPAGPSFDKFRTQPPASGIGKNDYGRNFDAFLKQRPAEKPFCFWMGFSEPHLGYERGSGIRSGKRLEDVSVPAYLPDTEVVRNDLLDYAVEVEWADSHIGKALQSLEAAGELENTLVIVTSDHGMPFPFVKGQVHEDGFHLPLAIRWGKNIKPGRIVEDFVNVRDFAPTFLELAGLDPHPQMTGRSLVPILRSENSGWVERDRNLMLVGKERHDIGRPHDWGYPVRALRTPEFLYVHNFHPDRWPAGNPESDFGNCDPSPTKELLKSLGGYYYDLAFGKRPADALFRLSDDPECVRNLAHDLAFGDQVTALRKKMLTMLRDEKDPRALGQGAVFDQYKYVGPRRKGYETWLQSRTRAETRTNQVEAGGNWPSFRGPQARGVSQHAKPPLRWSAPKWKTAIPGLGHSCPVIWGDRLFVTTAISAAGNESLKIGLYGNIEPVDENTAQSWQLLCLNKKDGRILWTKTAHTGIPRIKRHPKSTHANSTPATDGKHLVTFFGAEGLFCYDMDGALLWRKDFGQLDSGYFAAPDAQWGFGSSPVIHNEMVIVQCDVQTNSFIAAFDIKDGREIWRTPRNDVPTWSTPTVDVRPGRAQVIANGFRHIGGYDLLTGKELWKLSGAGDIPVPTPIVDGELIYITSAHGRMSPVYAIRAGAHGDISLEPGESTNRFIAWSISRGGNYMQTPIVVGDYLYCCKDNGVVTCFDAKTGEVHYNERLGSGGSGFTASPVSADGKLYYTSEQGTVYVLKAGPEFEVLATNDLGEPCMATPAISGNDLFFRTKGHVTAISGHSSAP